MNSAILSHNRCYQSYLKDFLAPAVGSGSQWLLCYRASFHGWALSSFHSRCDGKHNTVTLIKNGPYVFGGYTDIPWGTLYYLSMSGIVTLLSLLVVSLFLCFIVDCLYLLFIGLFVSLFVSLFVCFLYIGFFVCFWFWFLFFIMIGLLVSLFVALMSILCVCFLSG